MKFPFLIIFVVITTLSVNSCSDNSTSSNKPELPVRVDTVKIDAAQTFQTIAGFGEFGGQRPWYSGGPYSSPEFVNTIVNDLGVTIIRDELPVNFEPQKGEFNIDSPVTGTHAPIGIHLPYLRALKEAGIQKIIVSVWSPPAWMKSNHLIDNGMDQGAAPKYDPTPDNADNELLPKYYDAFAKMCAHYIKVIKQKTGIQVYGLSIQNEPRFSEPYASCVYNGEALRRLVKAAGARFKKEGIKTKLFIPEDIGSFSSVKEMAMPTLNDPKARKYIGMIAVHGYVLNGVDPASSDAKTWQKMYNLGKPYNIPLWMTETSGFSTNWNGAMKLAKGMYTALRYGNVSGWVWWRISTNKLDDKESLMSSRGLKSKRYYASKNFYRYIRPGALRISATTDTGNNVYPVAFKHKSNGSEVFTLVLINTNRTYVNE